MSVDFTDMWNLKTKQYKINEHAEQQQTHRYREHFDNSQMGGG